MQVLPRVTGTESAAITWSGGPGKPGVLQPVREGTLPAAPRPAFPPRPPIPVLSPQISTRPSCFPQTILTCPLEGHLKPVLRPKPQVLTVTEVPSLKREELSLCRAGLAWNHDSGLFMTPRQKPVLYKHLRACWEGLVLPALCCAPGVDSLPGTLLAPLAPAPPGSCLWEKESCGWQLRRGDRTGPENNHSTDTEACGTVRKPSPNPATLHKNEVLQSQGAVARLCSSRQHVPILG